MIVDTCIYGDNPRPITHKGFNISCQDAKNKKELCQYLRKDRCCETCKGIIFDYNNLIKINFVFKLTSKTISKFF